MLVQHQRYGRGNRLHPAAFVQTDSLFYRLFKQRPRFGVDLLGLNAPRVRPFNLTVNCRKSTGFIWIVTKHCPLVRHSRYNGYN